MCLPIYMIHLDLTFNISHPAAKKSIFCLFVCFSKRYLYTSKAFLITTETKYSAIRHFRRRKLDQVNFRKGFWDCYWRQREKAVSHLRGTKPSCWRAKVALGQDKWRKLPYKIMCSLCLSCPSATFARQRGSFVPRELLAAKNLLDNSWPARPK